ncbi:MAG TPA: AI-2E family transporter, partial [Candidatus Angelobacter sp.]|nr:AI-2E family transporter [Candidatus Angelobacter sp.]
MESLSRFIRSQGFIRFATILFFVLVLYLLRDLINLILFTFIFSFLIGRLHVFLMTYLKKIMPINSNVVVIFLYLLIVALVAFLIYRYLPIVIRQVSQLIDQLVYYYDHPPDNPTFKYLDEKAKGYVTSADLENRIKDVYNYITNIGKVSVQIFLALLLSLFFLLEKGSITNFTAKFRTSKIGPVFAEIEYFGRKFANTFGKVIEVQFLIAFVNAVLSTIFLAILGFPKLFGLGLMIFLL